MTIITFYRIDERSAIVIYLLYLQKLLEKWTRIRKSGYVQKKVDAFRKKVDMPTKSGRSQKYHSEIGVMILTGKGYCYEQDRHKELRYLGEK